MPSPPIKLKICLGINKTSSSGAVNSTKYSTPQVNPVSKQILDKKSGIAVTQPSRDKTAHSNRNRKGNKFTSSINYQKIQTDGNEEDVIKVKGDNKGNGENDSEYDEEEKWLNAVESGNYGSLDQIDSELKNIKDPKLMTARQRAMVSGIGGR